MIMSHTLINKNQYISHIINGMWVQNIKTWVNIKKPFFFYSKIQSHAIQSWYWKLGSNTNYCKNYFCKKKKKKKKSGSNRCSPLNSSIEERGKNFFFFFFLFFVGRNIQGVKFVTTQGQKECLFEKWRFHPNISLVRPNKMIHCSVFLMVDVALIYVAIWRNEKWSTKSQTFRLLFIVTTFLSVFVYIKTIQKVSYCFFYSVKNTHKLINQQLKN